MNIWLIIVGLQGENDIWADRVPYFGRFWTQMIVILNGESKQIYIMSFFVTRFWKWCMICEHKCHSMSRFLCSYAQVPKNTTAAGGIIPYVIRIRSIWGLLLLVASNCCCFPKLPVQMLMLMFYFFKFILCTYCHLLFLTPCIELLIVLSDHV